MCQPLVTALHCAQIPFWTILQPCSITCPLLWTSICQPTLEWWGLPQPSPWQGGRLWLRKGLHHCCCSKGTAALQTRLCWQLPWPQACVVKDVWKEKLAPACVGAIGQGEPHTSPGSRAHRLMGSTYTLLPTMPWVRCSHPGAANRASPGCQQWGWKMGVMKHQCISLPCSHTRSNGCCHPKAASLVLAATGLSPRRVAGAEVELGSRQQQYTQ